MKVEKEEEEENHVVPRTVELCILSFYINVLSLLLKMRLHRTFKIIS